MNFGTGSSRIPGATQPMQQGKKLTAVLAALDTFAEVRDVLLWLQRQTARDSLEILVVCQDLSLFQLPDDVQQQVGPLRFLECGKGKTLAEARAIGCREAETEFVMFTEDHCFPEPVWCERVLERLEEGWAGVGGAFLSANPQTSLARGKMLVGYGQWMYPAEGGEMPFIAGHGSVFRREVLMGDDEKLEQFLVAEALMMIELRRKGHRFYCESDMVSWHFDGSNLAGTLTLYPAIGRSLAAQRSISWPPWRRFLYGLVFPLIGLVRWQRGLKAFLRTRRYTGFSVSSLVAAAGVAFLWSWSEWRGFWFGFGNSLQVQSDSEHNRLARLSEGEWPHPRRPEGMSREEFQRRTRGMTTDLT